MRPIRLDMEGFGAFRHMTSLDWSDADLLALVGPTGSGKSTVIDAITFALYGSVARYDNQKLVAPIINQLSHQARVSLTFEVSDTTYVATRVVKRTKAGASTSEARLERGATVLAASAPEVSTAITELLGLTFERFTRTVVLPQGRFAAFLHDRGSDRQELMRHLLDLGMYSRIGQRARQMAKDLASAAASIDEQLANDFPSEEDLAAIDSALGAVDELVELGRTCSERVATMGREADAVRSELESLAARRHVLADVSVPESLSGIEEVLVLATGARDDAEKSLDDLRAELDTVAASLESHPPVELCSRQLADWASVNRYEAELAEVSGLLEAAAVALVSAGAEKSRIDELIDAAAMDLHEAETALGEARRTVDDGPDRSELDALRRAHDDRVEVAAKLSVLDTDIDGLEQRIAAQGKEVLVLTAAAERAYGELERHRQERGAASFRDHLHVGESCPLCLNTVDVIPPPPEDDLLESLTAEHERTRQSLDAARRIGDDESSALAEKRGERSHLVERQAGLEEQLREAPSVEQLGVAVRSCEKSADLLAAAQAVYVEAQDRHRKLAGSDAATDAQSAVSSAAQREGELSGRISTLQAKRDDRLESLREAPSAEELERLVVSGSALQDQRDAKRAEVDVGASRVADAVEAVRAAVAEQLDLRAAYQRVRDSVASAGAPPEPSGRLVDDYADLARWCSDAVETVDQRTAAATQAAARLETKLADAAAELSGRISETVDAHPVTAGLAGHLGSDAQRPRSGTSVGENVAFVAGVRGALVQQRQLTREALAKANELAAERAGITSRHDVAQELGRLLRTDGFERWLMSTIVSDLAARATSRLLELSGGQFSLVAHESEFAVIDHANADEQRDTRTLSGGETFLASLALALALADSIADMAPVGVPPLGSLFLDEGFGTLDSATLDVVAGAIEELGASGRMVGIITHIRELADRMPVRFEVARLPSGSVVERVEV